MDTVFNVDDFATVSHAHFHVIAPLTMQALPLYLGLIRLRRGYQGRTPRFELPDCHWIIQFLHGRARMQMSPGATWTTIQAGQALLLDSDDPWPLYVYDDDKPGLQMGLIFGGEQARGLARELRHRFGSLYNLAVDHPAIKPLECMGHGDLYQRLPIHMRADRAHRLVMGVLETLWEAAPHPDDSQLETAMRLLVEVPDRTLAEVAVRLHCSSEHLCRLFRLRVGESPNVWRRGMLLDQIFDVLRQGTLSTSEAAVACGYRSVQGFLKAYRARFGKSPGRIRVAMPPLT